MASARRTGIVGALLDFMTRTAPGAAPAVDGSTRRDFELQIGEAFRRQGYQLIDAGGSGATAGTPLLVRKERQSFLVECRHWKTPKVGVEAVRQLSSQMAAKGVAGGFVVTSGRFSREAAACAQARNVRLIDGPVLEGLLRQTGAMK